MTYWVESLFMPVDPHVLTQMKVLANSVNSSDFMREKAGKITVALERKVSLLLKS
jgi:hypothetical protein